MANTYTAVTKQDGGWWIGWIEEVPGVNCQERSRELLLASLRTTLAEALELNREDALRTAVPLFLATQRSLTTLPASLSSSGRPSGPVDLTAFWAGETPALQGDVPALSLERPRPAGQYDRAPTRSTGPEGQTPTARARPPSSFIGACLLPDGLKGMAS